MPRKPRPDGPQRFARDFTVLVAQEAARAGKRRVCKPAQFVKWARSVLRASGDPERLAQLVGHKLRWLVYGPITFAQDRERCVKKAKTFIRRHRFILAEQVLADNAATYDPPPAITLLRKSPPIVNFAARKEVGRGKNKKKRRRA